MPTKTTADTGQDICPNCEQAIPETAHFCPHCGQETRLRPPKMMEFLQEFAGNYLAVEGALWRTLKLLLLQPGMLTRNYLAGQRRKYVLPLRLYLSISLLALFGMGTLFNAKVVSAPPLLLDIPQSHIVVFDLGVISAGLDQGKFYCDGLPDSTCQRLQQRLTTDPASLWQQATLSGERFIGNLGSVMFVLVPVFALLLHWIYARRHWRYAEHLVFALHIHSFWFLMLCVAVPGLPFVTPAAWLTMPIYTLLATHTVYGGRWSVTLLRLALLAATYTLLLAIGLSILMLWILLY
jgi:hypothetical protein